MELSVLNILAILASAVNTRMIFELTFSLIVKFFQMSLQCQFAMPERLRKNLIAFKNENLTGMHDQMTLKIRIPSENFFTFWAADDFVPMKQ